MRRRTWLLLAGSGLSALAGCSTDSSEPTESGPAGSEQDDDQNNESANGTDSDDDTDDTEDGPGDVTSAAERVLGDMTEGAFDRAAGRFRSDLQSDVSAGQLEQLWMGYTAVAGSFEEIGGTEQTVQSGFDGVDFALTFEEGTHELRVLVDDQADFSIVGVAVNDEYERPSYVDSAAFSAQERTVETESCLMDGTLTLPEGADGVPGVVLVHGSDPVGAADQDLSTVGAKPFKDLAEGLASQGVAVLRYDRRSHACPNSLATDEWTLDAITVDDPLVAVDTLRSVSAVDPDRIAVAGLSLGGMAAPRIAERDGNLAGIAMLAAPARNFYEIFIEQFEYLATVGEFEWDRMATLAERWSERIDRIRNGDYVDGDIVLGYPGALWRTVDEYDQVGTAQAIDTPMFLLQGGRDYQVSVERDYQRWQDELADRPETTFELYEGLNHVFQYGEGPSVQAEYNLANPVDEAIVSDLGTWIKDL